MNVDSSLRNHLKEKKMTLIVSLPKNNLDLAKAALSEGADAVKMHVNVNHRASGNKFHSTETYFEEFQQIRAEYSGPLGIVPGGSFTDIRRSEMSLLTKIGFDFFSIYAHHMPNWMMQLPDIEKTFAITSDYSFEKLGNVKGLGITALEASIVPSEEYGTPLTFQDILSYKSLVEKVDVPVLIPSQRKLVEDDISMLSKAGVKGVMLGAIVVGHSAESIKKAVSQFRSAIDNL